MSMQAPEQIACPIGQRHCPPWQLVIGIVQATPQVPQLALSVFRFASQPSFSLSWLQSANPALQAPLHTPCEQAGTAMLLLEQALAQAPQWRGSVCTLISQPSSRRFMLQSAKPVMQTPALQEPAAHIGITLLVEQASPQPPQLRTSDRELISQPSVCLLPLQSRKPLAQAPVHIPPVQAGVTLLVEQAMAQPPQLRTSCCVLMH